MKTPLLQIALLLIVLCFVQTGASAQKRKPVRIDVPPPNRLAGLDTTFARFLTDWNAVGFAGAMVER